MDAEEIVAGRAYYMHGLPKSLFVVDKIVGEKVVYHMDDRYITPSLRDLSPDEMSLDRFARKMYAEYL